jgi:hypothetical protein
MFCIALLLQPMHGVQLFGGSVLLQLQLKSTAFAGH